MQTKTNAIDSLDIGEFICQERKAMRWSRADLSHFSGVDKTSIAHYETGECHPRFDTVNRLLSALGFEIVLKKKGTYEQEEDRVQSIRRNV